MAYDVNKVLKIAEEEIGYLEKSAAAYKADPTVLDRKTDGAGKDNYTKYGRDMNKIYPATMNFADYWCDSFVDWCFYQAYGVATAKSLLGGGFDDYTVGSATMYKNHNAIYTTPQVGDQVFFTRTGDIAGCYHTGLVIAVNGTKFTTIEGNTSATGKAVVDNGGCVAKKSRTVSKNTIFGRPNYGTATINASTSTKKETKTETKPGSYLEKGHGKGERLTVTASNLMMRTDATTGSNGKIIDILPRNSQVLWYGYYRINTQGEKWLYVQNPKNKRTGYCHSGYLK